MMVEEYLSLTVRSQSGESEPDFKARLTGFWTHMLRNQPNAFEKVYAETARCEKVGDRLTRQYLLEVEVAELLAQELEAHSVEFEPIDSDELYSKYEAVPPEWFWIEH